MTGAATTDSPARSAQTQIDVLQAELNNRVKQLVVGSNLQKNDHYMVRHDVIMKAIQAGQLPRTFWADAIIAVLETPEGVEEKEGRLLGSYDAALLRDYLQEMRVKYTEEGVRVTLLFSPNPFFEETELWGEDRCYAAVDSDGDDDKEDNDEEDNADDEVCHFSGITWKPGHGPEGDDDDNEDDRNNHSNGHGNTGRKRERSPSGTRGWTFLDVFSKMPPHPEEDDLFDEEDEDELADAVESWEAEMEDRRDLLLTLVEDVWADPVAAIAAGQKNAADGEGADGGKQAAQKAKTE